MPGSDENVCDFDEAAPKHSETDGQDAEKAKGSPSSCTWWTIEPGSWATSWVAAKVSELSSSFTKLLNVATKPWIHVPF